MDGKPFGKLDDYEFSEGEEKQDIFTKDEYSGSGYFTKDGYFWEGYYFKYTNLHKYIKNKDNVIDIEDADVWSRYYFALEFLQFLDSNYESLSSTLLLHSYTSAKTLGNYLSWFIKDKVVIVTLKFEHFEYGANDDNLVVQVDYFENGQEERISNLLWGEIEDKDGFDFKAYYITDIEPDYHELDDITHKFVKKVLARFDEKKFVPCASLMSEMYVTKN